MMFGQYPGAGAAYAAAQAAGDVARDEALRRTAEAIGAKTRARMGVSAAPAGPASSRLQAALKSLGALHGDPELSKLKVDGIVGPGTTKAVNHAIAQKYVVMKDFPRPELTVQHVRQFAAGIAAAVEGAVRAGGGQLVAPKATKPASRGLPVSLAPLDPSPAADGLPRWAFYAIGGVGVLLALTVVAKLVRVKPRYRIQETEA